MVNSRCYCGNQLVLSDREFSTKEWRCNCCFKEISNDVQSYVCNNDQQSCIYRSVKVKPYRSCSQCFTSNDPHFDDDLKANDKNSQSFVYRKFKVTLAMIS